MTAVRFALDVLGLIDHVGALTPGITCGLSGLYGLSSTKEGTQ